MNLNVTAPNLKLQAIYMQASNSYFHVVGNYLVIPLLTQLVVSTNTAAQMQGLNEEWKWGEKT